MGYDEYQALVEYEWAPIDRLGFEVELPFTLYSKNKDNIGEMVPNAKLNSIKLATQWTFLVDEKSATSMALGYINELELSDFKNFGQPFFKGNVYSPFFVAAKRWGSNWHTLLYTGPLIEQDFKTNHFSTSFQINTNVHYMLPGSRNFIGVEMNKTIENHDFGMVIRPQMRLALNEQSILGIVVGVPISKEHERMSAFLRLIWEPPHKK